MLAFAHIPTGTATNHRFDIDEVNSRLVKPGVAPTAYRSRYRNWQGHTLTTGSGCLTIGVHLTLIVPPSFSGLWNISLPSSMNFAVSMSAIFCSRGVASRTRRLADPRDDALTRFSVQF